MAADHVAEVARQDRRAKVLALRVEGLTVRAIGARLGVSHTTVETDLEHVLGERESQTKAHARALATERIEAIVGANMPTAIASASPMKCDAGKLVLSALALDAKINGYEAPAQHELTGLGAIAIHVTAREAQAFDAVEEATGVPEINGARH